jgi:GNAT superfamily N-acetyltransferase
VRLRHVTPSPKHTVVELMAPSTAVARQILRCYRDEILSRYYGRQATDQEIDAAIREDPSDDLALPHGALLVAHQDEAIWGCAGLRFLPDRIGEVKRVFITPAARGRGLGARLMGELECLAREHELSRLRLDTRRDLVEARRLYARLGYKEVAAFNDNPYADHWFVKTLT